MWKCHKCRKPVYFAERKQSLGYDWHPECLRCEECGKRLNPGQHAEHKGVPYCHVPCYGALFGPQLFGHGTRVESHTSFGKKEPRSSLPRSHLESKLKVFNQYYEGKSGGIRSREVNGRLILEGALRIHWGVRGVIHLKEDDDQRTVVTARNKNPSRHNVSEIEDSTSKLSESTVECHEDNTESCETSDNLKSLTLPMKLDVKAMEWDELDELLQVERPVEEGHKLYQTMPENLPSISSCTSVDISSQSDKNNSNNESHKHGDRDLDSVSSFDSQFNYEDVTLRPPHQCFDRSRSWIANSLNHIDDNVDSPQLSQIQTNDNDAISTNNGLEGDEVVLRRKQGSTAIKRRPGGRRQSRGRLRRRCSINGHFYNRETSFFTPPHGSQMSVWVTSLVNTQEVINLMLDKYKVDARPDNFALFVIRDNGEQRRLRDDEYPLEVRVVLGPHETIVRLFLVDKLSTPEISSEVAQFLNLSLTECQGILLHYQYEEERQIFQLKEKYEETRRRIKRRMEELKVRL